MPRFYFDFKDGESWTFDDEGSECDTPAAAIQRAKGLIPTFAGRLPKRGGHRNIVVRVRDETEREVDTIKFLLRPNY